jgi:hypothetical protein
MKVPVLTPEFVEFIPEMLEEGKIYISEPYATAVHKCCCGCGHKVVTPLSPTGWRLTVDDGCVSLYPSIGNWSFPCRSHYWIKKNHVRRSYQMSQGEINVGRQRDAKLKEEYFEPSELPTAPIATSGDSERDQPRESLWKKLTTWLLGK